MRIDRLLCELNIGSRSQVKELIKKGAVLINGEKVLRPEFKVSEEKDRIVCEGKEYRYRQFVYFMMNKPSGIITATEDSREITVLDLFREELSAKSNGFAIQGIPVQDMFPVGRLDKDTVGLLVLTNDGVMAHELLSPVKHVPKTYFVRLEEILTKEQSERLKAGITIGKDEQTAKAGIEPGESGDLKECYLTITEGKFHQVKRMFQAIGNQVIYLKRVSMGNLKLDDSLPEGKCRELTEEEVKMLCLKI